MRPLAALAVTLALSACSHAPSPRTPARAEPRLVAETLTGEPFQLGGPGPVRLIELWATWCGPCVPAAEHAREVLTRHPRVVAYAVAVDDDREAVASRAETVAPGGPILLYPGGLPAANRAGIDRLPMFVALDTRGHVVGTVIGFSPALGAALDGLLARAERRGTVTAGR